MPTRELSDVRAHEQWMAEAIGEAEKACARGEVPVGAVVVVDGSIVGRGHNLREATQDPTAHAELIAVRAAALRLGTWRLGAATLYVTLEPCPMCAGLLVNARLGKLVYGCVDPKAGAVTTLHELCTDVRLNHRVQVESGVLAAECGALLTNFFSAIRQRRRGNVR